MAHLWILPSPELEVDHVIDVHAQFRGGLRAAPGVLALGDHCSESKVWTDCRNTDAELSGSFHSTAQLWESIDEIDEGLRDCSMRSGSRPKRKWSCFRRASEVLIGLSQGY
jgi:hypothetical protein